jgi:hypothetical protein
VRILLALLLTASFGFAQKVASVRAGLIYYGSSPVLLDDTEIDLQSLSRPVQVDDGQTVGSPAGHLEILMGSAAVLWMQRGSRVRFDDTRFSTGRVTILEGSGIVEIKKAELDRSITVVLRGQDFKLANTGVFRFDAQPWQARVYSGEMRGPNGLDLESGQRTSANGVASLDRDAQGEFHYWAALRSFILDGESGKYRGWKVKDYDVAHAGFGIRYPQDLTGARIKYLAVSDVGVVYRVNRGTSTGAAIGEGNAFTVDHGPREIFLGSGIVARLSEGSVIRMMSTDPAAPIIRLEAGSAVIETANDAPRLQVEVGGSVTEVADSGLYEFDAEAKILWVYAGESKTAFEKHSATLKGGQTASLTSTGAISKFDPGRTSSLLKWSADQSFELYAARAPFMTNWGEATGTYYAKHKVFGTRYDARLRPNERVQSSIDMSQGPRNVDGR